MNNIQEERFDNDVRQYVSHSIYVINIVLLLCHIFFIIIFRYMNITFMYYFNYLSIAVYLSSFLILKKRMTSLFISVTYTELYVHMVLAAICVGWEFGFQQYCFGIIPTIMFTDYFINDKRKIRISSLVMISVIILSYALLKLWTCHYPPLYHVESHFITEVFFLVNAVVTMLFTTIYLSLYGNSVFRLEGALKNLADRDELTGLYNRRQAQRLINAAFADCSSKGSSLCIAILDVDLFKNVNDTYGHDAGDEVLKSLSSVLCQHEDNVPGLTAARWGGEEFIVLHTGYTDSRDAIIAEFEFLRMIIENTSVSVNGQTIRFTSTIGVAFSDGCQSVSEIIKKADDNLYIGKNNGRNQVVA